MVQIVNDIWVPDQFEDVLHQFLNGDPNNGPKTSSIQMVSGIRIPPVYGGTRATVSVQGEPPN